MARRRLLTREALARHFDPSTEEHEITRHFTLGRNDLDPIANRHGNASRLDYAMVVFYMRRPGRVLEQAKPQPPQSRRL